MCVSAREEGDPERQATLKGHAGSQHDPEQLDFLSGESRPTYGGQWPGRGNRGKRTTKHENFPKEKVDPMKRSQ